MIELRRAWRVRSRWGQKMAISVSSFRHALETGQIFGDLMECLLVDGEDRHLRRAILGGVVERAGFQNRRGKAGATRDQMRPAIRAEFSRHWVIKVAARKTLGRALRMDKAALRHHEKHVRR